MQFALLGDHPDGIDLARSLVATGRYDFRAYSGPAPGRLQLARLGLEPRGVSELEELLADPDIELVIVAGNLSVRSAQLKRAMQSECHVVCVHPADPAPDTAYEAALIQTDTGRVLLPMLPMPLHPGVQRLADLAKDWRSGKANRSHFSARALELEVWSTEEVLLECNEVNPKPGMPGWDVARCVGGEIDEIYVQAPGNELNAGEALLLAGRFQNGVLLQAAYLPDQAEASWRVSILTTTGRATLRFTHGWPGPALLTFTDASGADRSEAWPTIDPWLAWIDRFEQVLAGVDSQRLPPEPLNPAAYAARLAEETLARNPSQLGWQDELRALELDDAARRSVHYRRSSTLDLQEVTEEAGFKGTMTLVGCSMIWLTVIVLIVSVWVPWITWLIVPLFAIFLVMQGLRWVLPKSRTNEPEA